MKQPKTILIDEVEYIRKDKYVPVEKMDNMEYVIIRTDTAGCFAGYLQSRKGKEVVIRNARRLWYWEGASSLSQLAMEGVKNPDECKFPCEVDKIILTEAVEIISCTEEARLNIKNVWVWEQK